MYTDKQWQRFWKLTGKPEYSEDEPFATMKARTINTDDLYAVAGALLTEKTSEEWLVL